MRGRGVLRAAGGGGLGAGLVLLLAAFGFAAFSWEWATRSGLPVRNLDWDSATPGFAAGLTMFVVAQLLITVAVGLAARMWVLTVVYGGFIAPILFALCALPRYHRVMTTDYLPAQQVPSAFAGWLFAFVGAVLLAVSAIVFIGVGAPRPRVSPAVGAVIGVLAVVPSSLVIMADANPGRAFDATTAARVTAPPIPTATGTSLFDLRVETVGDNPVRAAGAGFVVRTPHGVRAFDSSGTERWHHLHAGSSPWQTTFLGVFDDGATVVVAVDSGAHDAGALVGLDAVTGDVLWRTPDGSMLHAVDQAQGPAELNYLTVTLGWRRTRIDTRTGRELWRVEVPDRHQYLAFNTPAGIGYFMGEAGNGGVDLSYLVLDPQTGATRFDIPVGTYPWKGVKDKQRPRVLDARNAGPSGVVFTDGDGRRRFLNAATGTVVEFESAAVIGPGSVGGPDGEFVTQTVSDAGSSVALRDGADGRVRCSVEVTADVRSAAWLADAVLLADSDGVSALRRADCTKLPTGLHAAGGQVVVAPGAVLVVDTAAQPAVIAGFG